MKVIHDFFIQAWEQLGMKEGEEGQRKVKSNPWPPKMEQKQQK